MNDKPQSADDHPRIEAIFHAGEIITPLADLQWSDLTPLEKAALETAPIILTAALKAAARVRARIDNDDL